VKDLDARAAAGQDNVEDVQSFLSRSRAAIEALPAEERRKEAAQLGAGRVLLWLWNRRETLRIESFREQTHKAFFEDLCWFLHAEDLEAFIWKWVILEAEALRAERAREINALPCRNLRWTNYLLGSLATAHLRWQDTAHSAILQLQRMIPLLGPGKPLEWTASYLGAAVEINRALRERGRPACSVERFDWYLSSLSLWHAAKRARDQDFARLLLYHPTRPDPMPTLWLAQRAISQGTGTRYSTFFSPTGERTKKEHRNAAGTQLLRAAYLFTLFGNTEHAGYLEELVQRHHDVVWQAHQKTLEDLSQEQKLQFLIRSPVAVSASNACQP